MASWIHRALLPKTPPPTWVKNTIFDEKRRALSTAAQSVASYAPSLFGELHLPELVLAEVQLELLGEVLDGRNLLEDLLEAFVQEPIEGVLLDRNEVGKLENLVELGETDTIPNRHELIRQAEPLPGDVEGARQSAVDGTANEQSTRRCGHRQRSLPGRRVPMRVRLAGPGGQPARRRVGAGPQGTRRGPRPGLMVSSPDRR